MPKSVSVILSDNEEIKLDELVEFFQRKSITKVTRSDVIKFLINKVHDVTQGENLERTIEFYHSLGVEFEFEVIDFNNNKDGIFKT